MKFFIFISHFLLFLSCSHQNTIDNLNTKNSDNITINTSSISTMSDETNENFLYSDTTLSKDFDFEMDFNTWIVNEEDLSKYENLLRFGDTLKIKTEDTILLFINEAFDEEEQNYNASSYIFTELYNSSKIIELQVQAYEYSYHILVDLISGDTISTIGKPLYNENTSIIFCSNVDLEVGYTENGFQIIKKDSLGFNLIETNILDSWAISKSSWLSKNQLMVQKTTLDENYNFHYKNGFLTLPNIDSQY